MSSLAPANFPDTCTDSSLVSFYKFSQVVPVTSVEAIIVPSQIYIDCAVRAGPNQESKTNAEAPKKASKIPAIGSDSLYVCMYVRRFDNNHNDIKLMF